MLKEMLLEEAKQITVDVALDDLFESVELSPEVKENFGTIYAQAVKLMLLHWQKATLKNRR